MTSNDKSFVIIGVKFLGGSFSSINSTYICMDFSKLQRLAWDTKWIVADDEANNKYIPQVKIFSWHLNESLITSYIAVMYCIVWKLFSYYFGLLIFSVWTLLQDFIVSNETDWSQEWYSKWSEEAKACYTIYSESSLLSHWAGLIYSPHFCGQFCFQSTSTAIWKNS